MSLKIIIAGGLAAGLAATPLMLFPWGTPERARPQAPATPSGPLPTVSSDIQAPPKPAASQPPKRQTIHADEQGRFITSAIVNGGFVRVRLNPHAKQVLVGHMEARKLGITPHRLGAKAVTITDAGRLTGALAKVDSIRIGNVTARNVTAIILEPPYDTGMLLGSAFFSALTSHEIKRKEMLLVE